MADFEQGFSVAQDTQCIRMWIGPIGGPWNIEKQFDDQTLVMVGRSASMAGSGRFVRSEAKFLPRILKSGLDSFR